MVSEHIQSERYEFYGHALIEAKKDGVRASDILHVLMTGKVIEEYPDRGRLLVYWEMPDHLPLHVVYDLSDEDVMYIPTVYIPSQEGWIKFQIRKGRTGKKEMSDTKKIRKCPECGGNVEPGKTEMVYDLQYRVRINNVPANICDKCGEVFLVGRVASELDRLVDRLIEDVESFAKSQPQIQNGSRSKEIAIAV